MQQVKMPVLDSEAGVPFLWNYLVAHSHPRSALELSDEVLRFLSYCFAGFKESRAQLFQDLYVSYKLHGRRNGFFVEFGAMDGLELSNTYYLERCLAWNGILAEPFPGWSEALRNNRAAVTDDRCVWWESNKTLDFVASHANPEFSSLAEFADGDYAAAKRAVDAKTIQVRTVSLNDLLTEHKAPADIDYLSVDTEGSELDILSAFDFDRFRVSVITVEHNFRPDIRSALHQLLSAHGFVREFEQFSRFDDWYFHPERVPPAP